jgi:large subunit ribosomal protein L4
MKIVVKDLSGQSIGDIELSDQIFKVAIRPDIMARVVAWQLAKRRSGTHKTKGISDISGTTRKPYRQKGSGRARQGSLRSPQFRGGAVIFGPVVRSHAFSLPKKVRSLGLKSALSSLLVSDRVSIIEDCSLPTGKTKDLVGNLKAFNSDSILIIGGEGLDENLKKATSNLFNVNILPQHGVNVYDMLRHKHLLLTRQAVNYLEKRLLSK